MNDNIVQRRWVTYNEDGVKKDKVEVKRRVCIRATEKKRQPRTEIVHVSSTQQPKKIVSDKEAFSSMLGALYRNGNEDAARNLMISRRKDYDVNAPVDDKGNRLIHCACRSRDTKGVKYLMSQKGILLNMLNNQSETALMIAMQNRSYEVIHILLGNYTVDSTHNVYPGFSPFVWSVYTVDLMLLSKLLTFRGFMIHPENTL